MGSDLQSLVVQIEKDIAEKKTTPVEAYYRLLDVVREIACHVDLLNSNVDSLQRELRITRHHHDMSAWMPRRPEAD